MRIAGGVLFLIVGLWSLGSGGCSLIGGSAVKVAGNATGGIDALQKKMDKAGKASGATVNTKAQKEAMKNLRKIGNKAGNTATGAMIYGVVALLASILSIIAGIMLFMNKGKMLAFIAGGIGILGEIIFFAMVSAAGLFLVSGIIKIILYAVGAAGGTGVKQNA